MPQAKAVGSRPMRLLFSAALAEVYARGGRREEATALLEDDTTCPTTSCDAEALLHAKLALASARVAELPERALEACSRASELLAGCTAVGSAVARRAKTGALFDRRLAMYHGVRSRGVDRCART